MPHALCIGILPEDCPEWIDVDDFPDGDNDWRVVSIDIPDVNESEYRDGLLWVDGEPIEIGDIWNSKDPMYEKIFEITERELKHGSLLTPEKFVDVLAFLMDQSEVGLDFVEYFRWRDSPIDNESGEYNGAVCIHYFFAVSNEDLEYYKYEINENIHESLVIMCDGHK